MILTHTIQPSTVFVGQWNCVIFTRNNGIITGDFGSYTQALEFYRRVCGDILADDDSDDEDSIPEPTPIDTPDVIYAPTLGVES